MSNPSESIDVYGNNSEGIDVSCLEGDKYAHSFHVHRAFHGFIIGRNSNILKCLEQDTETTISIPKHGKDGDIVINGPSRTAVVSARTRIDSIVQKSRKKLKFTHFLAIPMTDKTIAENYDKFKNAVLNDAREGEKGVRKEIFQKPERMHLTLGMLTLLEDKDVETAIAALEECKEKIMMPIVDKHGPIKINARGLGWFGNDTGNIRVLYGSVSTDNNVLQELAEKTADFFVQKGLMKKDHEKITLHLTLMNVSFAISGRKSWTRPVEKINASDIIEDFKDYSFGESVMSTVQICQLGPMAEDGYYRITSKINLAD